MRKYLIVIEKADSNYSAYSPDVPGCITTGNSREETRRNMREALELHLEGLAEDSEPIPKPESSAEYILINEPELAKPSPIGTRS